MSRPRFLSDNDLNDHIVRGVTRREPAIEFHRVREWQLATAPDDEILAFAANGGLIVVSHDLRTMAAAAFARLGTGAPMYCLLLVEQSLPVSVAIDQLILIWAASEAEEWKGVVQYLPL